MKESFLFEYIPADNLLNRTDPVLKLIILPVYCVSAGIVPPVYLSFHIIVLLTLFALCSPSTRKQLGGMWKIYLFFAAAGAVKYRGSGSIIEGASFSVRLVLMSAAGLLFYTSTRLSAIRRALGGRNHFADIAVMSISFLPLIFKTVGELQNARSSRCFKPARRPFRALKLTALPLIISMLLKTDELTDAWYSRAYTPRKERTDADETL